MGGYRLAIVAGCGHPVLVAGQWAIFGLTYFHLIRSWWGIYVFALSLHILFS